MFYGKSYRYKDKVIGVCGTLSDDVFMIGYATSGGHKRMKALPLFGSLNEAQEALSEYAAKRGLIEDE